MPKKDSSIIKDFKKKLDLIKKYNDHYFNKDPQTIPRRPVWDLAGG